MKEQVSEVYLVGLGYGDYNPERLNIAINAKISNGWRVGSMVSINRGEKSSVVVVYERDVVKEGEKIQI